MIEKDVPGDSEIRFVQVVNEYERQPLFARLDSRRDQVDDVDQPGDIWLDDLAEDAPRLSF